MYIHGYPHVSILFRGLGTLESAEEALVAAHHFYMTEQRANISMGTLVVGRYSVLPYYEELTKDLTLLGAKLINSYKQHRRIADIGGWYLDFEDVTPKTWFFLSDIPDGSGPYVVKGRVNSRKGSWDRRMFAHTRADAFKIAADLMDDPLLAEQGIVFRKYEPLVSFGYNVGGCPIANEWRYFILNGEVVARGYYWDAEDAPKDALDAPPDDFVKSTIAPRLKDLDYGFVVADVAQKVDGSWCLIELNDAQMSGLSSIPPETFYKNLASILHRKKT